MDEAQYAKHLEVGRDNARLIGLAADHCQDMRFVESGGRGMLEEISGLPLNMRRVECPLVIGGTSAMRLEHVVFDFYGTHCVECQERKPTGRLPNLETEVQARRQQAETDAAARAEAMKVRKAAWSGRTERRRSLRATADPAVASILDDLDVIDADPALDADASATAAARRRLTTAAGRAADRFTEHIIDELFDAVSSVGLTELLEPLRHLTSHQPKLAHRLVTTALAALRRSPSLEAGRCLSDHSALIHEEQVDNAVIGAAVVLAGSKTPDDHFYSGPTPVVQANDPGPLRLLAGICPRAVVARLEAMLPRPVVSSLIVNPAHQPPRVSDLDRWAAAGAVEHLAGTHLDVALQLVPALALSLAVPPQDGYDPGTLASAERALARTFTASPVQVAELLETAGRYAPEAVRDGLVGSVRQALDMTNPESGRRRAEDPMLSAEEAVAVTEAAFTFLLARCDESWGTRVTFSAAEVIAQMKPGPDDRAVGRVDAALGAFAALTRRRHAPHSSRLPTTAAPDPLASVEAWSRKQTLYQAGQRLLRAVESASRSAPLTVCTTITTLIENERDNDLGADVVEPLLGALGEIGRRNGDVHGLLQAIIPTLHTYMVDAEPGLRAAALQAWTTIGAKHSLPSTAADLLRAFTSDDYVVMIRAVLSAARRLPWPDQNSRILLVLRAAVILQRIAVPEYLDIFVSALSVLRHHAADSKALSKLEIAGLSRLPDLPWHQATDITRQPWTPDARVCAELARVWLRLAPHRTFGLRQREEAEEALNGLLECGAGLLGLPSRDIIEVGAAHSPESAHGSLEYAEVLARSEQRLEVVALLDQALTRIPDEPARASRRAQISLAAAVARLQVALGDQPLDAGRIGPHLDDVAQAISTCLCRPEKDLRWLGPVVKAAAVRAAIACALLNIPVSSGIAAGLSGTTADGSSLETPATADPASAFKARGRRLRELATLLETGEDRARGTATHSGVLITAQLLSTASHLLEAEGADFDADITQATAHRTAATRRAAAIDVGRYRDDDPLLLRARALQTLIATASGPDTAADLDQILASAAGLPAPLLFIGSSHRRHGFSPWQPPEDPEPDSETVAVALVFVDDTLLTGPAILDPALTHTLTLQVQTDPWPAWVRRMDAELVSTLNASELQRPALTWQRHQHTGDPDTYVGTGSLHVRYAVPSTQHAPPVLVRLTWRGVDEKGRPKSQALDIAGHREFRVRPFDPARDATTQYEVFDEHLLGIYEKLAAAGYPRNHLQPFARLLNAISRAGLAMTWNKKYRRGQPVSERQFHDDLHAALLSDPTLEGRVERGAALGHGYLDTRHDGITAELKVARDQPVTPSSAAKYIGQPTQYAAADGVRLSILVILDMSRKVLPIGTPENYLFQLGPAQHGMTDPSSPSVVVTLIVNGNLPVPSSWSRRRTPTVPNQQPPF